jgi:hypothetical protein
MVFWEDFLLPLVDELIPVSALEIVAITKLSIYFRGSDLLTMYLDTNNINVGQ